MIDDSEFRRVMGHFATGVTVVTSLRPDGGPCGLTMSAVASVSLDPMLVLACVDRGAETHDCLAGAGCFAVNVLPAGAEDLARRFATRTGEQKFRGVGWRAGDTGAPLLDDALAWVDCRVAEVLPGGDHTIFLGEVVAGDAATGEPLVYYRGGYGRFAV